MRTMFSDSHPNVGKANHQLMGYGELVPTFAKKYGDTTWYEAPKHAIKHEFCTRPEDFRHGCCIIFHDINVAFGWDDLSVPSCPKQNFLTYDVVSWGKKKVSQIRNRQQSRWTDYEDEDDEDDDDDIYIYHICNPQHHQHHHHHYHQQQVVSLPLSAPCPSDDDQRHGWDLSENLLESAEKVGGELIQVCSGKSLWMTVKEVLI